MRVRSSGGTIRRDLMNERAPVVWGGIQRVQSHLSPQQISTYGNKADIRGAVTGRHTHGAQVRGSETVQCRAGGKGIDGSDGMRERAGPEPGD